MRASDPVPTITVTLTAISAGDDEAPRSYTKGEGGVLVVGRASRTSGNKAAGDNALFSNQVLSRSHATIAWQHDGVIAIKDDTSTHGTVIKRSLTVSRVGPSWTRLLDGDQIVLGKPITRISDTNASVNYQPLILEISIVSSHHKIQTSATPLSPANQTVSRKYALYTQEQLFTDEDEDNMQVGSGPQIPCFPLRPIALANEENSTKARHADNMRATKRRKLSSRTSSTSSGVRGRLDEIVRNSRKPDSPSLQLLRDTTTGRMTTLRIAKSETASNGHQSPICIPSSPEPEESEHIVALNSVSQAPSAPEIVLDEDKPDYSQSIQEMMADAEAVINPVTNELVNGEAPEVPREQGNWQFVKADTNFAGMDQLEDKDNNVNSRTDEGEDARQIAARPTEFTASEVEYKFVLGDPASMASDDGNDNEAEESEMEDEEDADISDGQDIEDIEEDAEISDGLDIEEDENDPRTAITTLEAVQRVYGDPATDMFQSEDEYREEEIAKWDNDDYSGEEEDEEEEEKEEEEEEEEEENEMEEEAEEEITDNSSQIFDLAPTPPLAAERYKFRMHRDDSISSDISDDHSRSEKARLGQMNGDSSASQDPDEQLSSFQELPSSTPNRSERSFASDFVSASELSYRASPEVPVYMLKAKKTKKPMRDAGVQVDSCALVSMAVQAVVEVRDIEVQVDTTDVYGNPDEVQSGKRTHEVMIETDRTMDVGAAISSAHGRGDTGTRPKKGLPWRVAARYTTVFALGAVAAVVGLASIPDIE